LRSGQYYLLALYLGVSGASQPFFFIEMSSDFPRQMADTHKADIMAVMAVDIAGISQPCDKFHTGNKDNTLRGN